jgi:hypothetical protein
MCGLVKVPIIEQMMVVSMRITVLGMAHYTLSMLRHYDADLSNKWFTRKPGLTRSVSSSVLRLSIVSPLVMQPSSERTMAAPLRC